jgi:hypothetical protein
LVSLNWYRGPIGLTTPLSVLSGYEAGHYGTSFAPQRNNKMIFNSGYQRKDGTGNPFELLATTATNWRIQRASEIIAGTTSLRLLPGLHTVLHVIPFKSPDGGDRFERIVSSFDQRGELQPVFSSLAHTSRRNADSYLIYSGLAISGSVGSYLQVFRNGFLESVNTLPRFDPTMRQKRILSLELEIQVLRRVPQYFAFLKNLGAQPPVILGLSLTGVEGYSMEILLAAAPARAYRNRRIKNDTLFLPHVMANTFECSLDEVFKPAFDAMWRAAGWEGSIFYDNSEWVGLARSFPRLE